MAKSEKSIEEKVAIRKEHKKRKKTKGCADVKATQELFEADTKLSNENDEGDEPKLKKSKQIKKMREEKSDDFKAEIKKIIDEGRKTESHFVSGSVESNNDTVGNGNNEAKPKRAKKKKNKHEDTEGDIEMKTKENITNKTENGSNSPDKEAHDKDISNQKIGKAKASKSKKKDLKNIENDNSSPEEENLEKVIEGNDEENIKGILNQMETAKLKKIKKSTEKRKKSKTEDDELKNGEQKDDLVPAKKRKKFRDNRNTSEENKDVESSCLDKKPKEEPGIEYLLQWKNDRSNWFFKKIKQIWLLRNMYDQKKVVILFLSIEPQLHLQFSTAVLPCAVTLLAISQAKTCGEIFNLINVLWPCFFKSQNILFKT